MNIRSWGYLNVKLISSVCRTMLMKPTKKDCETMFKVRSSRTVLARYLNRSLSVPDFTHPDGTVLLSLSQTDTIVLNKHEVCKKTERESETQWCYYWYIRIPLEFYMANCWTQHLNICVFLPSKTKKHCLRVVLSDFETIFRKSIE